VIVTEQFSRLASTIAKSRGRPGLPILVLPANIEDLSDDELEDLAHKTLDQAAEKLTEV
jgi:hypothetical protein